MSNSFLKIASAGDVKLASVSEPGMERLRQFMIKRRERLGFTQRQLADAASLQHGTVGAIEAGKVAKAPSIQTIDALGEGLRVDPNLLIEIIRGRIGRTDDEIDMLVKGAAGPMRPVLGPGLPEWAAHLAWDDVTGGARPLNRREALAVTAIRNAVGGDLASVQLGPNAVEWGLPDGERLAALQEILAELREGAEKQEGNG